jgi:hypothetical protein
MSNRLAVVNKDDEVVNVILAEPDWTPPEGHRVVEHEVAGPGWVLDGDILKPPKFDPPPDPGPEKNNVDAQLREAISKASNLQELKDALLGKNSPASIAGRRP